MIENCDFPVLFPDRPDAKLPISLVTAQEGGGNESELLIYVEQCSENGEILLSKLIKCYASYCCQSRDCTDKQKERCDHISALIRKLVDYLALSNSLDCISNMLTYNLVASKTWCFNDSPVPLEDGIKYVFISMAGISLMEHILRIQFLNDALLFAVFREVIEVISWSVGNYFSLTGGGLLSTTDEFYDSLIYRVSAITEKDPPLSVPMSVCVVEVLSNCKVREELLPYWACGHSGDSSTSLGNTQLNNILMHSKGNYKKILPSIILHYRLLAMLESKNSALHYLLHCMIIYLFPVHRSLFSAIVCGAIKSLLELPNSAISTSPLAFNRPMNIAIAVRTVNVLILLLEQYGCELPGLYLLEGALSIDLAGNNCRYVTSGSLLLTFLHRDGIGNHMKELLLFCDDLCRRDAWDGLYLMYLSAVDICLSDLGGMEDIAVSSKNTLGLISSVSVIKKMNVLGKHLNILKQSDKSTCKPNVEILKRFLFSQEKLKSAAEGSFRPQNFQDNSKMNALIEAHSLGDAPVVLQKTECCIQQCFNVLSCAENQNNFSNESELLKICVFLNRLVCDRHFSRYFGDRTRKPLMVSMTPLILVLEMMIKDETCPKYFLSRHRKGGILLDCMEAWRIDNLKLEAENGYQDSIETNQKHSKILMARAFSSFVQMLDGSNNSNLAIDHLNPAELCKIQIDTLVSVSWTSCKRDSSSLVPGVFNLAARTLFAIEIASEHVTVDPDSLLISIDETSIRRLLAEHNPVLIPSVLSHVCKYFCRNLFFSSRSIEAVVLANSIRYVLSCISLVRLYSDLESVEAFVFFLFINDFDMQEGFMKLLLLGHQDTKVLLVGISIVVELCKLFSDEMAKSDLDIQKWSPFVHMLGFLSVYNWIYSDSKYYTDAMNAFFSSLCGTMLENLKTFLSNSPDFSDMENSCARAVALQLNAETMNVCMINTENGNVGLNRKAAAEFKPPSSMFVKGRCSENTFFRVCFEFGIFILPSIDLLFCSTGILLTQKDTSTNLLLTADRSFTTKLKHLIYSFYLPVCFNNKRYELGSTLSTFLLNDICHIRHCHLYAMEVLAEISQHSGKYQSNYNGLELLYSQNWAYIAILRFIGIPDRSWMNGVNSETEIYQVDARIADGIATYLQGCFLDFVLFDRCHNKDKTMPVYVGLLCKVMILLSSLMNFSAPSYTLSSNLSLGTNINCREVMQLVTRHVCSILSKFISLNIGEGTYLNTLINPKDRNESEVSIPKLKILESQHLFRKLISSCEAVFNNCRVDVELDAMKYNWDDSVIYTVYNHILARSIPSLKQDCESTLDSIKPRGQKRERDSELIPETPEPRATTNGSPIFLRPHLLSSVQISEVKTPAFLGSSSSSAELLVDLVPSSYYEILIRAKEEDVSPSANPFSAISLETSGSTIIKDEICATPINNEEAAIVEEPGIIDISAINKKFKIKR